MQNEDLKITIKAFDEATDTLKKINSSLRENSSTMKKTGDASTSMTASIIKGAAAYDLLKTSLRTAISFLRDSFTESINSARIMAQVETNVKNAGFAYDELSPKIRAYGENAIKLGFDDEIAAQSLSKLLLVTKDYGQAQALTNLAMDLARAKNIDLETATKQVTLATQGNVKELKLLGINLDENATTAQNMKSMQDQLKDSASNYSKTTAGQLETVKQQWDNIKQAIGDRLIPKATEMFNAFEKNLPEIEADAIAVANAISSISTATTSAVSFLDKSIKGLNIGFSKVAAYMVDTWADVQEEQGGDYVSRNKEIIESNRRLAQGFRENARDIANSRNNIKDEIEINKLIEDNEKLAESYNKVHKEKVTADQVGSNQAIHTAALKAFNEEVSKGSDALSGLKNNSGSASGSLDELKNKVSDAGKSYKNLKESITESLTGIEDDHKQAMDSLANDIGRVKKELKDLASSYKSELSSALKAYTESSKSNTQSLVESIIANEDAIAKLKAQLTGGGLNAKEKQAIESELAGRLAAEESNAGIIASLSGEIAKQKEYNAMSELDRAIYDYQQRKIMADTEYSETVARINATYKEKKLSLTKELNDLKEKQNAEEKLYDEKTAFIKAKMAESLTVNKTFADANLNVTKSQVTAEIEYYEQLAKAIKAARSANTGAFANIKNSVNSITTGTPSHEHGGIVIGPRGMPVPIIAHGGETITPAGKSGNNGGNSIVVNINNPQVRNNSDLDLIKEQVENVFRDVIRINKLQF